MKKFFDVVLLAFAALLLAPGILIGVPLWLILGGVEAGKGLVKLFLERVVEPF